MLALAGAYVPQPPPSTVRPGSAAERLLHDTAAAV
jgi:hypothetical protein